MLTVTETMTHVRAACGFCGAHNKLPRFRRTTTFGRFDQTTPDGEWLRCTVCGDLSRLEDPAGRYGEAAEAIPGGSCSGSTTVTANASPSTST